MAEQDFIAIMRKYNALMGEAIAKGSEAQRKNSPTPTQATSNSNLDEELTHIFNTSEQDKYLEDRFVRAPVAAPEQKTEGDEGYEHVMFNSLFASLEASDVFNQNKVANRERFFKENELALDLLAADFARKLYQYELDLRQQYDPSVGMYPTQALYAPKATKLKWTVPKQKELKKEIDLSKRPRTRGVTEKEASKMPKTAHHEPVQGKTDSEKSEEDEHKKQSSEDEKSEEKGERRSN